MELIPFFTKYYFICFTNYYYYYYFFKLTNIHIFILFYKIKNDLFDHSYGYYPSQIPQFASIPTVSLSFVNYYYYNNILKI